MRELQTRKKNEGKKERAVKRGMESEADKNGTSQRDRDFCIKLTKQCRSRAQINLQSTFLCFRRRRRIRRREGEREIGGKRDVERERESERARKA